jgi:5'(3')-deoxyribonucleotidase
MTKIIGIDCDDVLCETIHECLKTSFFTERNIKKADITSYNLRECPNLNITLAEAKKVFFDFFSSEQYRDTQPIP